MSETLQNVALINLSISAWTGRKTLKRRDIRGEAPPADLANLGTKKIIDPKKVNKFASGRRRAERLIAAHGVKTMGIYAIPMKSIDTVVKGLKEIQKDYLSEKDDLISTYESQIESWRNRYPSWQDVFETPTSVEYLKSQIQFNWHIYKVGLVEGADSDIEREMDNLGNTLMKEIASDAIGIYEAMFMFNSRIKKQAIASFQNLLVKVDGLSFLDTRANILAKALSQAIKKIGNKPWIEGEDFSMLNGLVYIMMNPDSFDKNIEKLRSGNYIDLSKLSQVDDPAEFIESLASQESETVDEEAENNISQAAYAPDELEVPDFF